MSMPRLTEMASSDLQKTAACQSTVQPQAPL